MAIEKIPFKKYNLEKSGDLITVRLNKEERELLQICKKIIEQPKDSTALKTLALIGSNVLQDNKTAYILATLFKNKRNNERLGIPDYN